MKKLAVLVLAVIGLTAMAATCRILNVSLTEIDGDATFAGELKNETTAHFLGHRIVVAFLDDNGNVLETKTVDGCLRSLQANTSDFFAAAATGEDPDDVEVGLARLATDSTLKVGTVVNGDVEITNVEATRNDELLRVTGRISNEDNDDLEDVRACVVVYDEDDKVVQVARDNNTFDLDSDDDTDFSIDLEVPDDNDLVTEVSVWVDATNPEEDDKPTKPEVEDQVEVDECANATSTNTPVTNTATPVPATNTPTPVTNTATPGNTSTNTPTRTSTPDDAC